MCDTTRLRQFRRAARKVQCRLARSLIGNGKIVKCHAVSNTGAQRLGSGFFGGKALSQETAGRVMARQIGLLRLGQDPGGKTWLTREHSLNTRNLNDVCANPCYRHLSTRRFHDRFHVRDGFLQTIKHGTANDGVTDIQFMHFWHRRNRGDIMVG